MLVNPEKTKEDLVAWIRDYFLHNGKGCSAVVGISGGKDSSVVAASCVQALGKDRVIGVLMPNGVQSDIADARALVSHLDIPHITVNIKDAYGVLRNRIHNGNNVPHTDQAEINLAPRLRMAVLYYVAQSLQNGGRVANTCNMSEDYVGYSTKYGDSAGDFSPLQNLMVHEVKQIGRALGLPQELVDKKPSDGLCGKTDEENLGFTYDMLDSFIATGSSGSVTTDLAIQNLHIKSLHKYLPIPSYRPGWNDRQNEKDDENV